MQFVTVVRRSGERIAINPALVCYVREVGNVTVVAMISGQELRVQVPGEALAAGLELALGTEAGDKRHVEPLSEPPAAPPPGLPPAPGAPAPPEGVLAPQPDAPAADQPMTEEEEAELQQRAQRASHEDGDAPHRGGRDKDKK